MYSPPSSSASPLASEFSAFRPVDNQQHQFPPVSTTTAPPRTTFWAATIDLEDVYRRVCPTFSFRPTVPRRCLTKPSEPCYNENFDNQAHDLVLHVHDVLVDEHANDEYIVIDMLGTGTFGQVVRCLHKKSSSFVAVKIVKNQSAYLRHAWIEISLLHILHQDRFSEGTRHIVQLHHHFHFRNHLCLVFEKLNINLYELLRQNRHLGVGIPTLRTFLSQLLKALTVLARCEIVHCDVKPENILLNDVNSTQLKLIDFGSACQSHHTVYSYVQSRFYRSPEILLGMPRYTTQIDMWSLGCVAGELFLGYPIFPGQNSMNMLRHINDMLGSFPDRFLRKCSQTAVYFNINTHGDNVQLYELKSAEQYEAENNVRLPECLSYFQDRRLWDIIMNAPYQSSASFDDVVASKESFVDFLGGLLKIDPEDRWTPLEALQHPFITVGRLPHGVPWQPHRRRHIPRSRPVFIDNAPSHSGNDEVSCVSAPGMFMHGAVHPAGLSRNTDVVDGFDVHYGNTLSHYDDNSMEPASLPPASPMSSLPAQMRN